MKRISIFLVSFTLSFQIATFAQTVFIIIHGTWATNTSWWKPGGDFFDEMVDGLDDSTIVTPFTWSGKLDNKSRLQAGKELAQFIQSYPADTTINIVGHSHGGNVAFVASQELARLKAERTISKVYALAVPISTSQYMPAMHVIDYVYNFFSLHDYIQPVLGIFSRTMPDHPRIVNIRVVLEGKSGSHSDMHDPLIARWLPAIHELLTDAHVGNFHQFEFAKPGAIYFFNDGNPYYKEDREQDRLLRRDRELLERLSNALTRTASR